MQTESNNNKNITKNNKLQIKTKRICKNGTHNKKCILMQS